MLGTTTTSLIAFIVGVLVNVGKKIVCIQCRFKCWSELRDIGYGYDIILQKLLLVYKTHSSSSHVLFLAICFALSWPPDSLLWVLISHVDKQQKSEVIEIKKLHQAMPFL